MKVETRFKSGNVFSYISTFFLQILTSTRTQNVTFNPNTERYTIFTYKPIWPPYNKVMKHYYLNVVILFINESLKFFRKTFPNTTIVSIHTVDYDCYYFNTRQLLTRLRASIQFSQRRSNPKIITLNNKN